MKNGHHAGFFLLISILLITTAAGAASKVNTNTNGFAIHGYDTVAYFTIGKYIEGKKNLAYEWMGAKWLFTNKEHKELFIENPDKYAPRYGGYCAYGVAVDALFDVDPKAWTIVDGELYLNKNLDVRKTWKQDISGNISKTDRNWPDLLNR